MSPDFDRKRFDGGSLCRLGAYPNGTVRRAGKAITIWIFPRINPGQCVRVAMRTFRVSVCDTAFDTVFTPAGTHV